MVHRKTKIRAQNSLIRIQSKNRIHIIIAKLDTYSNTIGDSRKKGYKYFLYVYYLREKMSSDEENIRKKNGNSTEVKRTHSRPDFSSRIINSLYKFHEFIMN